MSTYRKEYEMCDMSQSYSVGGSSYAVVRSAHCSKLFTKC